MKKISFVLAVVFVLMLGIVLIPGVKASEGEKPCIVVVQETKNGEVKTNINDGEIGEVCIIEAEPSFLYEISEVYVNGSQLIKNEDGTYQFNLVEGENKIDANFIIDSEKIQPLIEVYNSTKEGGLQALFSKENIAMLVSWILDIFLGAFLVAALSKSKKIKEETKDETTKECVKAIQPEIVTIAENQENVKESVKKLVKCFILSNENTPQARLQIVEELSSINNIENKELSEKVKEIINKTIEEKENEKKAKNEAISNLEQTNNNLNVENLKNSHKNENEGRV